MSGTVYKAASGALLQQMRLDMISNNLANVNTSGYKADIPIFRVDAGQTANAPAATHIPGTISPLAPPMEARIDFSTGALVKTGNSMDVGIVGKGFFEIQAPEGTRYTRKGNFTVNEEGQLSTLEGWPVMGTGGTIQVEGSDLRIGDQGEVYVDGDQVNALRLVDFPEPYELDKVGDSLFVPKNGAQPDEMDEGTGQVAQGFVEQSNVNAIQTMTQLIETVRVFETYQRIIRSVDDVASKTVNEVGSVA